MQFHHHGYVSGDPRVQDPAATGLDRPVELPDTVDVLIVGTGPAGMILAAQLGQFPRVTTRIVERRSGRLAIGQADGIQARSVETFQAFGFANRIIDEAYRISHMNFWSPDPGDPTRIIRTARTVDDEHGISEFPHLIVNQARVLDYFAEFANNGPARIAPDFGYEFVGLEVGRGQYPVTATLRCTRLQGQEDIRTVRAKYVVGCDGAHSAVREAIGCKMTGDQAFHAWAVMDVLAVTDFPDIRLKCAIQSQSGSILLIPREGGYLFRLYVDLGEVDSHDRGAVRSTSVETAIARANEIFAPYTLDVRDVAWSSVYEVGHRLTDRFDDVPADLVGQKMPHVFIAGDACHTHSAKAGQGMNVSMQDGFNLGWKLGYVLGGLSPESLLATYSAERQVIAKKLIDFDKEWSGLMAKKPDEFDDPAALGEFYLKTAEFPAGFMTQYTPSMIVSEATHQDLAVGFPVGKRFKSVPVARVADGNSVQLGHHHRADGRWRVYVFADALPGESPEVPEWAEWMATAQESPVRMFTPAGGDIDTIFDVKVIYPGDFSEVPLSLVPDLFLPRSGPLQLIDYEKVYAIDPARNIAALREITRSGAVVVVRPDQYVAATFSLTSRDKLATFLSGSLLRQR